MGHSVPVQWVWRSKRELPAGSNPAGHVRLDRQLVTALVAAGFQDGTAGTGSHARTKTVRFGPFPLVGLIGTLHENLFSNNLMRFAVPPGGRWRATGEQSYLTGPVLPGERVSNRCMVTLPTAYDAGSVGAVACG